MPDIRGIFQHIFSYFQLIRDTRAEFFMFHRNLRAGRRGSSTNETPFNFNIITLFESLSPSIQSLLSTEQQERDTA